MELVPAALSCCYFTWEAQATVDKCYLSATAGIEGAQNDLFSEGGMGTVPQRDADLLHLWTAYSRAGTPSEKAAALAALHAEVEKRDAVDSRIRASVWALLQQPAVVAILQVLSFYPAQKGIAGMTFSCSDSLWRP